jgi:hypothetical protein
MQKRKPGRPKTNPTSIHLTLLPDQLVRLDAFIAEQEEQLSRAEGVRRVLDEALPEAAAAPASVHQSRRPGPRQRRAARRIRGGSRA